MDTSRFIICRASAGSGKTYTLVRQYLSLAFDAPEGLLSGRFKRILAITFTNKAANEMKERIMREVRNIALHGTASPMGADIARSNHLDDERLKRYASVVHQSILHNYSDLAVCTIDSFMHRIVKTFAHDLGLPVGFNVYIDNTDLIQNAIDELMNLAGSEGQEELTEVLCDFAESKMAEGKSYMIERELTLLAGELFKERTPEYLRGMKDIGSEEFRRIHRQMTKDNRHYEHMLCEYGQEGLEIIGAAGLGVGDFYQSRNGAGAFFEKLAQGRMPQAGRYVLDYLEGDKLGSAKCPEAIKERLAEVKPALQEVYRRLSLAREEGEALYNTRTLLLKNLYALALMGKMDQLVQEYSKDNEIVHISEFNKRIAEVVCDEPAPFIYERLGSRYQNYLIDEFQDTSRMQWQNLVPLVENGIADGHTSLVVGDGKQAIYRFRQGDVGQFIALPHVDNPVHGRLLEAPGMAVSDRLEKNYRTAREIVEFNNLFFSWAVRERFPDNKEMRQIYLGEEEEADLVQQPVREGGLVQVAFQALTEGHEPLWEAMLDDLQRITGEGGYSYRDITLLARDKQTLAEISQYLTGHGIPVVSNESFLLSQSRVVMLLRSLLQYLINDDDRVAAARVLMYLHALGKITEDQLNTQLSSQDPLSPTLCGLDCDRLRNLSLYDCCEEALRMLHLEGIETAYCATLLNTVAKYSSTHRQDLTEFIEWLDQQLGKLSTSTASDLDAVKLMTIHKAKGLEAPVVMYPILNKREPTDSLWVHVPQASGLPLPTGWVTPSKNEKTLFDEEYEEELLKSELDRINILYVAFTRPRERLMVYCEQPAKSATTTYNALLRDYVGTGSTESGFHEERPGVFTLGEQPSQTNPDTHPTTRGPQSAEGGRQTVEPSLNTVSFPGWVRRVAIANQADDILGEKDNASRERGILIHTLLATAGGATGDQADGTAGDEDAEQMKQIVQQILSDTNASRFFDPRYTAKAETELIYQGEVLRPDRIVLTPDETWVVDFKTGMPRAEHHDQVERYCQAVSQMGYPTVKGYLLYIGGDGESGTRVQTVRVV